MKRLTVFVLCLLLVLSLRGFVSADGGITWEIRDNTLYISGEGDMDNYTYGEAPWYARAEEITAVVVGEGVTSVGEYGLAGLTEATVVTLPSTLTAIKYQAFQTCSALTEINIPEGVTSIGGIAFANCESLKEITLPEGLTQITDHLFYGCAALETVNLPSTLTTIGEGVFTDCVSLKAIRIPESVTTVGKEAFMNTGLVSVALPDHITWLEETFRYCRSLREVKLPAELKDMLPYVFQYCDVLEEITIPASVKTIREWTVQDCPSLKRIIFLGDIPDIDLSAFNLGAVEYYLPKGNNTWLDIYNLQNYGANPTYYVADPADICDSHSYGETTETVIPNTCMHNGAVGTNCLNCSAVLLEPVKAYGHLYCIYDLPATDTSVGYYKEVCDHCGLTEITFKDPNNLTYDDAVLFVQNAMALRDGSFEVSFWSDTPFDDAGARQLLEEAMSRGNDPLYGGYLRGHLALSVCNGSSRQESDGRYYCYADLSLSYLSTYAQEKDVASWTAAIIDSLDLEGMTDLEKIFAIHNYIVKRIDYDYSYSRYTAYHALRDDLAVCQGYTSLTYRLMNMAGLNCRYITGNTSGGSHAWNLVELDGKYYHIDTTWAEGINGIRYDYFLKGTADFFLDHTPDEEFMTPELLEKYPLAEENYLDRAGSCGEDAYWYLTDGGTLVIGGEGLALRDSYWPDQKITSVRIGNRITGLQSGLFLHLQEVQTVFFTGDMPKMESLGFFFNDVTCYYPGANSTWVDMEENSRITWLGFLESGIWGNTQWYYFNDKSVHLYGDGPMTDTDNWAPWLQNYHLELEKAVFHEGITHVGDNAMLDCPELTSVSFPSTLRSIGAYAFLNCGKLKTITFPEGLERIGDLAFTGCAPETLTFPGSLQSLGESAFETGYTLKEITFLGDAPDIGTNCFACTYNTSAYYYLNRTGWTEATLQSYGGWLNWIGLEAAALTGDLDGSGSVDTGDVVALLLHISMPELFPLEEGVNADLDGSGAVTTDDAVKLLLHISMPDLFPLS